MEAWTLEQSITITSDQQGQYLEQAFDMPAGMETIEVCMEVSQDRQAVIDLGIADPYRLRGWSGGARTSFSIGPAFATPGYLAGELHEGRWTIVHNAYAVPNQGCTVTVWITFYPRKGRWLKGDLHTHSVHSDGTYTITEKISIMEELGCDFLALTDHNTVSQNKVLSDDTSLVLIPGMEFTTNDGHSNFLGVNDPIQDFRVANEAEVHERFAQARSQGAKIVLNHPHCDYCPWEWSFDVAYDWIEVWNGPWSNRNARAIAWWQQQLSDGKRIVAVGGSDVHHPNPWVKHAEPCVWVWSEIKSLAGIMAGIEQGHVFISSDADGPRLELSCGLYRMGDIAPAEHPAEVLCRVQSAQASDRIRWYTEQGLEDDVEIEAGEQHYTYTATGHKFVRVEVWRPAVGNEAERLLGLSNPIYFAPEEPSLPTHQPIATR
ncbi:phosphoesterase [Paenibacillus sp. 598K]|uniref:CehA/McbA family metallohydrolase n=1 Tax=Paenibacillus sp. 598K TaxID=1117987 RepID=UPI000FF921E2|nr:CehA/McbA family metallohydrolase [Paenibacillus sp. 598K]GBF74025.1 phosphoesterase [Paenibacillus sp. 598K]